VSKAGIFKINKSYCDAIVLSTGISECSELQMPLDLIGQGHCRVVRAAKWRHRSWIQLRIGDSRGRDPICSSFPTKPAGALVCFFKVVDRCYDMSMDVRVEPTVLGAVFFLRTGVGYC
jgi:hypothetical protein